MKFVRIIKSEDKNQKVLEYQKKFVAWLQTYYKVLNELSDFCYECDDALIDNEIGSFNEMFNDLMAKATGKSVNSITADDFCFMPAESWDDADLYCKKFIEKAEGVVNKSNINNISENPTQSDK